MKILICGSRTFEDYNFLDKTMTDIISKNQYDLEIPNKELEIVSGNNPRGGDYQGEKWSRKNNISLKLFPADWNDMSPPVIVGQNYYGAYNKLAGINRNEKMVQYILGFENSICIAFDMDTAGTKDTIRRCKKAGIKTYQIKLDKDGNWKEKIWND